MTDESSSCHRDPNGPEGDSELVVGTLVEVSSDGNRILVELDEPDGRERRCAATVVVPIEAEMVGLPVRLTFAGGDRDRPVITNLIDVPAEIRAQWDALGRRVQGLDPGSRKIAVLVGELRVLTCAAAWFEMDGNITYGAKLVGTSRKSFRVHVRRWERANPRLVPVVYRLEDLDAWIASRVRVSTTEG